MLVSNVPAGIDGPVTLHSVDGSNVVTVAGAPAGPEFDGAWSPDSEWIVYRESTRGINEDDEIYIVLESRRVKGITWVHVRLPGRPNGRTGWVRRQAMPLDDIPEDVRDAVLAAVRAEIDKDYVKMPVHEIEKHLAKNTSDYWIETLNAAVEAE